MVKFGDGAAGVAHDLFGGEEIVWISGDFGYTIRAVVSTGSDLFFASLEVVQGFRIDVFRPNRRLVKNFLKLRGIRRANISCYRVAIFINDVDVNPVFVAGGVLESYGYCCGGEKEATDESRMHLRQGD